MSVRGAIAVDGAGISTACDVAVAAAAAVAGPAGVNRWLLQIYIYIYIYTIILTVYYTNLLSIIFHLYAI